MSVKRYSVAGTAGTPDGWHDYVLASDYDELLSARREQEARHQREVREILARLQAAEDRIRESDQAKEFLAEMRENISRANEIYARLTTKAPIKGP